MIAATCSPLRAPGGAAAAKYIEEEFGLTYGTHIFGIAEDGFSVDYVTDRKGTMRLTLIGEITRPQVERILALLWEED
jgi:hypothetical protein